MKNLISGLTMLIVSSAALAGASSEYEKCLQKAESNVEMSECMDVEYKRVSGILDSAISKAKNNNMFEGKDKTEVKNRITASQKAWTTYRDTQCKLEGIEMLGGSGEGHAIQSCLIDETVRRTKELSSLFENIEK